PLSALEGDNVVNRSAKTPWYDGPSLLTLLEQLGVDNETTVGPLRLPVQWVARHGGNSADDFRGYAGRIASGELRPGDEVVIQPSGVVAQVKTIVAFDGAVDLAVAG